MIDIDFIKNLRKKAYVDAINSMAKDDNVLGYFGSLYDEAFIYAHSLKALPIVGVDGAIFEYGKYYDSCDPIRSTLIYRDTDKCPLIFSSKMYLVDDFCKAFTEKFKEKNVKKVYTYMAFYNHDKLSQTIEDVYNKTYQKDSYDKASKILEKIDLVKEKLLKTDISNKLYNYANYYSRYIMDLDDRLEFFEDLLAEHKFVDKKRYYKALVCPYGIIYDIDYYILRERDRDLDYAPCRCNLRPKKYIKYLN